MPPNNAAANSDKAVPRRAGYITVASMSGKFCTA
jgi:hypothetical protein